MNNSVSTVISSVNSTTTKARQPNNSKRPKLKNVYLDKPRTLSYQEVFDLYTKDYDKAPFEIKEIEIEIDLEVYKTNK